MIKLNNKNITYIALAYSNNSLKAPKEIWYADSSNSVKLVYRRKDALIEGEDYEKYHWLKGDGVAYIRGINYNLWDNTISLQIGKTNVINNKYIGYNLFSITEDRSSSQSYLMVIFRQNSDSIPHIADIDPYSSMPDVVTMDFYIENSLFYCNQNGVVKTNNPAQTATESTWKSVTPAIYSTKMSYIREVLPNDTYRSNLIPVKLLKSVPKWLDANGIRRQVGECGMIDLVSGKFYGNVNSVGTFTVENYYERKEWLQGRNGAYINTNHKLKAFDDRFEVHARYDGTIKNPKGEEQNIFGYTHFTNGEITEICRAYINSSGRISCNYYTPDGNWSPLPDSLGVTDITLLSYVESTTHTVVLNGTTYTLSTNGMQSKEYGSFIALFSNNGDDDGGVRVRNRYFHGDIAYFKITDSSSTKMNLIPCTLTMDLPASMDANNIARTKGTSGMWDLVSDKFYGNVANSGTFKAVNLAEGVDYEVHQWLRTEVNTKATLMTLDINSYSFSFSRKPLSGSNVPYFITEGLDIYLYSDLDNTIRIWNSSQYGYYYSNTPFNWGDTISITSSSNSLVVNSKVIPQNTFPVHLICFGANDTNGTEHYTSSITVDGIERYIPVKLLKSIPSKYDANGIARQAGECGMYDTVNDKFYGNMASSGSFTVSDDN